MTQSLEDYIEAVYVMGEENGSAQVRDVAKFLSVKMPSVVKAIRELKDLELVTQEPYGPILLTTKGRAVARHVLNRHKLLRKFLLQLGVSKRVADRDACRMEHILSTETLEKIRIYTEKTEKDKTEKDK